jgi:hypothetical protein
MLRQNELAFLKALSSIEMSPTLFTELRMMLTATKKKDRPTVPAGIKGTTSGDSSAHYPAFIGLCRQAQSQRTGQLGRLFGARHQAPSARR